MRKNTLVQGYLQINFYPHFLDEGVESLPQAQIF